jgi:hypothetical protein
MGCHLRSFLVGLVVVLSTAVARSHSWYPAACCNETHCHPIACAILNIMIATGEVDRAVVQASQDEACHICSVVYSRIDTSKPSGSTVDKVVHVCAFVPRGEVFVLPKQHPG